MKLRGVNLGGWLVLEKWLTPSLFEGMAAEDEWTFMSQPGARERLERHRRTFIQEDDFAWLARQGINAVRIPVGYWVLKSDSPYQSGASYLDWAVATAAKYGLQVLIDLHAAPGSQNGEVHSGRIGAAGWFERPADREQTIKVLVALAQRYGRAPNLWGIELLNEPHYMDGKVLGEFYCEARSRLRRELPARVRIIFSDAYRPYKAWGALSPTAAHQPVMDSHYYQLFGRYDGRMPLWLHLVRAWLSRVWIASLRWRQPLMVGEWSAMLPMTGRKPLSERAQSRLTRRYIRTQLSAFTSAEGWFYWTYKTESGTGEWDFRWLVEQGLFPKLGDE